MSRSTASRRAPHLSVAVTATVLDAAPGAPQQLGETTTTARRLVGADTSGATR